MIRTGHSAELLPAIASKLSSNPVAGLVGGQIVKRSLIRINPQRHPVHGVRLRWLEKGRHD